MKLVLLFIALLFFGAAFAAEPGEILDDPALETRAEYIDTQLRCVVCQSQSIAESNAPLAKDLRLLVRERLVAGDTDKEVIAYVVERYGDYVLLKPPVQGNTLFLWAFPALALVVGAAGAIAVLRKRKPMTLAPISDEDDEEIDRILKDRG